MCGLRARGEVGVEAWGLPVDFGGIHGPRQCDNGDERVPKGEPRRNRSNRYRQRTEGGITNLGIWWIESQGTRSSCVGRMGANGEREGTMAGRSNDRSQTGKTRRRDSGTVEESGYQRAAEVQG